jgi:hypothetical protein
MNRITDEYGAFSDLSCGAGQLRSSVAPRLRNLPELLVPQPRADGATSPVSGLEAVA